MSAKVSLASVLPEKPKKFGGFWASVSKIKTFNTCPSKFKYSYIDRLPKKTWDHTTLGKFAHHVLEYFHQKRIEGDVRPDNELMRESFQDGCREYQENLKRDQKQQVHQWMVQYLGILAQGRKNNTLPDVLEVEEEFYIDIAEKVLLMGFIDVIQMDPDGVLHVADYKTSKSSRFLKKDDFQLKTYAYVKCLQDPSLEKIRCSYIMLKLDFEYVTFEFDRAEVMEMEKVFLKEAETIQAEKLFRPEPSPLCPYCDFLEACDEGREFVEQKNKKQKQKKEKQLKSNWGQSSW